MDTVSYLGILKNIDRRIKNKLLDAQRWREIAEGNSSHDYENSKVQTSPTADMMAQAVVNALECERQASDMANNLIDVRAQIISQIDGMEDELHYNLLYGYYLENKNYSALARQEGYTYKSIKRKFKTALKEFEKKYSGFYEKM